MKSRTIAGLIAGGAVAAVVLLLTAATIPDSSIATKDVLIQNATDTVGITIQKGGNLTGNFLEGKMGSATKFAVPASGVLALTYGGTGGATAAAARSSLGIPETTTNTVQTLATGGTGSVLADPNADRVLFWDDSGGSNTWLTAGTGLAITAAQLDISTVPLANGGTGASTAAGARSALELPETVTNTVQTLAAGGTGSNLSDPGADRIIFWDNSATSNAWLTVGTTLAITDTTIDVGTLPLVNGGTGATTAGGARTALELSEFSTNSTAALWRSSLELPETSTNTVQVLAAGGTGSALADPGADRLVFWDNSAASNTWATIGTTLAMTDTTLDVGTVPVANGGTGATTASGARTALALNEFLTNSVSGLKLALGIQAGSGTVASDGSLTNDFATAFSTAPIVLTTPTINGALTNWVTSITESNFVVTLGVPSGTFNFIAIGAP